MPTRCLKCGEDTVVWDDYSGAGEQQVCSSCGVVHCEGSLVSDVVHTSLITDTTKQNLNGLPDSFVKNQIRKMPEGLKNGKTHIRTICSNMALGSSYQTEALDMYEDLFYRPDFKRASLETKIVLATWCVYVACRKAGLPITMQYVANITGLPVRKLFKIHKYCKEIMSLYLPLQDVTELIETVLVNEVKPEITITEVTKQLTKDIVMLCKELWLVDGRQTHLLLLSVFFIAWQAESFIERKKAKITKICKKKSTVATCRERVKEIKNELCKLGNLIPWVSNANNENIAYYVKDVIKYQRSLMMDALRKSKEETFKSEHQKIVNVESRNQEHQESNAENSVNQKQCNTESDSNYFTVDNIENSFGSTKELESCSLRVGSLKSSVSGYSGNMSYNIGDTENPSFVQNHWGNCSTREEMSLPTTSFSDEGIRNLGKVINYENREIKDERCTEDISLKDSGEYFNKLKKEVETEHIFAPPSFKKARRKSIEEEEVLHFVKEGRKMMDDMASKLNESNVEQQ